MNGRLHNRYSTRVINPNLREWDRILLNSSSLSQLALLVEFLSEILFVGAPPARLTRTERSLI
ncbi:hypothetical protein BUZ33_08950 [Staphylococcus haemolyticus]|nr:hypothetical protein BUZ44_03850 [Staphylococcus haemolyticus]PTK55719.1 hypothetical protein BUZ33_08950 [Staphylococcus haemolyticus]PTK68100.1 hypothetical protein BUZ32_05055 [Staphylococcus haemolyticus]PTK73342.1 hypothetical protein BUZ29_05660 [Staphylococcus haemolyticus]PTL03542.1 hypothetical protein BUZ18_03255 [Staphylococcus haemolyticus]